MKKLQNNFTTPEQSKLLLELGVPADSADCLYYVNDKCSPIEIIPPGNRNTPHTFSTYAKGYNDVFSPENPSLFEWDNVDVLPCWSVGRLIEITTICREWLAGQDTHCYIFEKGASPLEKAISKITIAVEEKIIDFSKLED